MCPVQNLCPGPGLKSFPLAFGCVQARRVWKWRPLQEREGVELQIRSASLCLDDDSETKSLHNNNNDYKPNGTRWHRQVWGAEDLLTRAGHRLCQDKQIIALGAA